MHAVIRTEKEGENYGKFEERAKGSVLWGHLVEQHPTGGCGKIIKVFITMDPYWPFALAGWHFFKSLFCRVVPVSLMERATI